MIFPCSLAMQHKNLVGYCVAQSHVPLSQSTILVVISCNVMYKNMHIAVVIRIDSM
jgi:hypothetical protein